MITVPEPQLKDLATAERYAGRIVEILSPHCEIIHIAGSVRRKKPQVKDIEIVCIPRHVFNQTDMFGGGDWIVSPNFIESANLFIETIIKGKFSGRYLQAVIKGGMKMDLFLPEAIDYYRQFAIRTGSAEFSHKILATAWKAKGWVGTDQGLRMKSDCLATGTASWRCVREGTLPPVWKSEEEFFEWLGLKWIEPEQRGLY